jgi:hypothetical protein
VVESESGRGGEQRFAELTATSGRPDEQPRDHHQVVRRSPRRRYQLRLIDAGDDRDVSCHRAADLTNPRPKQARRIKPRCRVIRPATRIAVLPVHFGERFHRRRNVLRTPWPDRHPHHTPAPATERIQDGTANLPGRGRHPCGRSPAGDLVGLCPFE